MKPSNSSHTFVGEETTLVAKHYINVIAKNHTAVAEMPRRSKNSSKHLLNTFNAHILAIDNDSAGSPSRFDNVEDSGLRFQNTQFIGSTPVICHPAYVIQHDGTHSSNEPIVLDDCAKEHLRAHCTKLHEAWTAAPRPQPHGNITFTVTSNDELTQSMYQCQALYAVAFNVENSIDDRQAIVCGWLAGKREPVCSCRLTMVKTTRESAMLGDNQYSDGLQPVDITDCTSVDKHVAYMTIDNFAVHPSYQRHKIGTALAGHVKKWAKKRSRGYVHRLRLFVDYDSLGNCEFYSKLGFVIEDFDDIVSEVMMSFYYEEDPHLHRP